MNSNPVLNSNTVNEACRDIQVNSRRIHHPPRTQDVSDETKRRRKLLSASLGHADWNAVYEAYAESGRTSAIAKRTQLSTTHVNFLLEHGLPRLGLPPIAEHGLNRAELNRSIEQTRRERNEQMRSREVQTAIQHRATTEEALSREALNTTEQLNTLFGAFLSSVLDKTATGEEPLRIPPKINLEWIDLLAKAAESNLRTIERALKVQHRLAGKPSEIVEHQLVNQLASCTREELLDAEQSGQLPPRDSD